jgi:hypothetical protein
MSRIVIDIKILVIVWKTKYLYIIEGLMVLNDTSIRCQKIGEQNNFKSFRDQENQSA